MTHLQRWRLQLYAARLCIDCYGTRDTEAMRCSGCGEHHREVQRARSAGRRWR